MYRIWASVYTDGKIKKDITVESTQKLPSDALLECLEQICRFFDVSMPMWHTKHTKQFNSFRKIIFLPDDFIDDLKHDKMVLEIIDEN